MPSPRASFPRGTSGRGRGRESVHRATILRDSANTAGENQQCATLEPTGSGRLRRCRVQSAAAPSCCWRDARALHGRTCVARRGEGRSGALRADERTRADRDRAYTPEIALNGRTRALNNMAIISDGALTILAAQRGMLFNILSRSRHTIACARAHTPFTYIRIYMYIHRYAHWGKYR